MWTESWRVKKKKRRCKVEKFVGVVDCSVKTSVMEYTEIQRVGGWGESDMCPVVIVPPEIHPLFPFKRCDYTATMCAHTFTHTAVPAAVAVIQFRRLEGKDKEIEEAKRGVKG